MVKELKHVFFDLDHTLWDFERNSTIAFSEIFKKNKIELEVEVFLKNYIPINNFYWAKYRNNQVSKEALRFGRLHDTFQELNYSVSKNIIDTLSDDYITYLPKNNFLFADAHSTLNYLQQKYYLHVITNGFSEVQNLKIINSKINHYFKTITTSEEAGVKKPHPEIFEYALKKAKASSQQSLMIGDNLEADILGAENYGIKAILYDDQGVINYSGTKIKNLKQLLEII